MKKLLAKIGFTYENLINWSAELFNWFETTEKSVHNVEESYVWMWQPIYVEKSLEYTQIDDVACKKCDTHWDTELGYGKV